MKLLLFLNDLRKAFSWFKFSLKTGIGLNTVQNLQIVACICIQIPWANSLLNQISMTFFKVRLPFWHI